MGVRSKPAPPTKYMSDCPNINKRSITIRAGEYQIAERLRMCIVSLKHVIIVQ